MVYHSKVNGYEEPYNITNTVIVTLYVFPWRDDATQWCRSNRIFFLIQLIYAVQVRGHELTPIPRMHRSTESCAIHLQTSKQARIVLTHCVNTLRSTYCLYDNRMVIDDRASKEIKFHEKKRMSWYTIVRRIDTTIASSKSRSHSRNILPNHIRTQAIHPG